jgi:hypothetical protein
MAKTKIIVFRKGGRVAESEHWTYARQEVEIVNDKYS